MLLTTAKVVIAGVALAFIIDHGAWMAPALLYRTVSSTQPPASAYYDLEIRNDTNKPLMICAELLNDREFKTYLPREEYRRIKLGRAPDREFLLQPGGARQVTLPSPETPRLGCLLVTARSEIASPGGPSASQDLALYLLSWYEASYQNATEGEEPAVPTLMIEKSDLTRLDSSVDSPSAAVKVLRKTPEGVTRTSNWD